MHGYSLPTTHRTWENFLGMLLGVLIVASPWLACPMSGQVVFFNAALVGKLVFALAALCFVGLQRWEELAEMVCGAWLIAAPFVFGYVDDGQLQHWHFALGTAVVLLAGLELWKDWRLSTKDSARHGN